MSDSSETKWEYHVQRASQIRSAGQTLDQEESSRLKQLGEEGWELVGFRSEDAYFKRRKASKDSLQSIFEE